MLTRLTHHILITLVAIAVVVCTSTLYVLACPFCSAINVTFADQMKSNDIVVVAKLLEIPDPIDDPDAALPKAKFEVVNVLKGEEFVSAGAKFRTLLVGRYPTGKNFLVMGVDPPNIAWSTPMKVTDRVVTYLNKIQKLPESGADRLAFLQNYFEDEESVLAFDAYDEFAKAPYEDVVALKSRMQKDNLVAWIKDTETSINRRRLYMTMLGVCGGAEEIAMLEGFIQSGDRKKQAGLDALIGCYLTLKGADGLKLVEDTFIRDQDVEYVDTLSAVSALRFHGTETDKIPKEKIVASVRLLLERPKMADMIIPDLARWEDWSVMDRLVKMFKDADEETNWLRVPVISYLRACPKPEAKKHIEELREIDPDAIRRADFFLDFDEEDDEDDDSWGDEDDAKEDAEQVDAEKADTEKVDAIEKTEANEKQPAGESSEGTPKGTDKAAQPLTDEEFTSHVVLKKPVIREDSISDANSEASLGVSNGGSESIAQSSPVAATVSSEEALSVITPVAQAGPSIKTWKIVIFPMLISAGIFILLWSVISGWFERLIY